MNAHGHHRRAIFGDDTVGPDLPFEVLDAVMTASNAALTAGPDVPPFGSWAWCQLALDDPARAHAVMRAALAWWSGMVFGPGVPASVIDRAVAEQLAESSRVIAAAENWTDVANEIQRNDSARRRRASPPPGIPRSDAA